MIDGKGYTDLGWRPNIGKAVRIHNEPGKLLYRKTEATINYPLDGYQAAIRLAKFRFERPWAEA